MKKSIIIAIDGPAGAGKSTIAKIIAKRLNIEYIDSGAFYRAVTKNILDSKIKINDYKEIANLLLKINFKLDSNRVFINDRDYTKYLRNREVALKVSPVSSIIAVRKKVNDYLNGYAKGRSIVMDGRDIGSVVFSDADYKFYLDASVQIRALRRYNENTMELSLDKVKESIIIRDENDKNKDFGALKIVNDAVYIDTTDLSIDEVVVIILDKINK